MSQPRSARGLLIHAGVFVMVQTLLLLIHLSQGSHWPGWGALGWLIGLGAHALAVLGRPQPT